MVCSLCYEHPTAPAGGRMARELSKNPTVLIVNDTIFAHGGVMPVSCRKLKYQLSTSATPVPWFASAVRIWMTA